MGEKYLTRQEEIDNLTMRIETEAVQGSGFIQHPPQVRRAPPSRPPYTNQRYYESEDRGYRNYRPRFRPYGPRSPPDYYRRQRGNYRPDHRRMHFSGPPMHRYPRTGNGYRPQPRDGGYHWRPQFGRHPRPNGSIPGMPMPQYQGPPPPQMNVQPQATLHEPQSSAPIQAERPNQQEPSAEKHDGNET